MSNVLVVRDVVHLRQEARIRSPRKKGRQVLVRQMHWSRAVGGGGEPYRAAALISVLNTNLSVRSCGAGVRGDDRGRAALVLWGYGE